MGPAGSKVDWGPSQFRKQPESRVTGTRARAAFARREKVVEYLDKLMCAVDLDCRPEAASRLPRRVGERPGISSHIPRQFRGERPWATQPSAICHLLTALGPPLEGHFQPKRPCFDLP